MYADRMAGAQGWGITILRVVLGIVFAVHGAQKLFTNGIGGTAGFFGSIGVPLPEIAAVVVTAVELLGGIALILGFMTRYVAPLLAIDMLVATLMVHIPNGFFITEGGYEFTLIMMAASIALALTGSGEAAVDRLFTRRRT